MISNRWWIIKGSPGWRGYLLVFLLATLLFGYLQWQPAFADPDSFYHTRLVKLTIARGPVTEFPWLPLTTLAEGYADHHFLYHLLLIPFFWAFGPLLGIKVAAVMLAAGAVTVFYGLLRTFGFNRFPLITTTLLATCSGFIVRLNLAKTPPLAVAWLFLSLIALRRRNAWLLGGLAFSYVWLHASWPLLLALAAIYILADWLTHAIYAPAGPRWRVAGKATFAKHRRSLAALGAGLLAGLVINPFFPQNLRFYWEQVVQVAVINYRDLLPVGSEWYGLTLNQLIGHTSLLVIGLLVAAGALALIPPGRWRAVRIPQEQLAALVFAATWLVATAGMALRQQRHLEYFAPALALFAALLLGLAFTLASGREMLGRLREVAGRLISTPSILIALGLVVWSGLAVLGALQVRQIYQGWDWNRYAAATAWLEQDAPPQSLVINLRWDDFPPLFYHSEGLRWYDGLDPTFGYRANPERWLRVESLRLGEYQESAAAILDELGSDYLLLRRSDGLPPNLSHDPSLDLAYHDHETIIFKRKP